MTSPLLPIMIPFFTCQGLGGELVLFTDPGQQTCHVLALWDSVGLDVGFV